MATPSTPEGTPAAEAQTEAGFEMTNRSRVSAAEAQTEAGFEHKASEAVVKQMKMGQFMRENIKKWKDVVPLLKELQKRFPKRQWPRGNIRDTRNSLQCVEIALETISGGETVDCWTHIYIAATGKECKKLYERHRLRDPLRSNIKDLVAGLKITRRVTRLQMPCASTQSNCCQE